MLAQLIEREHDPVTLVGLFQRAIDTGELDSMDEMHKKGAEALIIAGVCSPATKRGIAFCQQCLRPFLPLNSSGTNSIMSGGNPIQ